MNRHLANEQIWQFTPVWSEVDADDFVSVTPFKPKDITITQSDGVFAIHGTYGIDIFTNHRFIILVNGRLVEFNHADDIPQEFDNIIEYRPDDTHDITFTYNFVKNGKSFKYTHWIHHDMIVWEKFLQDLMLRETNGGWKRASSNENR